MAARRLTRPAGERRGCSYHVESCLQPGNANQRQPDIATFHFPPKKKKRGYVFFPSHQDICGWAQRRLWEPLIPVMATLRLYSVPECSCSHSCFGSCIGVFFCLQVFAKCTARNTLSVHVVLVYTDHLAGSRLSVLTFNTAIAEIVQTTGTRTIHCYVSS